MNSNLIQILSKFKYNYDVANAVSINYYSLSLSYNKY